MNTQPFSEAEILAFRKDTKGTTTLVHFNNAGASLPPDIVTDTITTYLQEEILNGSYETEEKYRPQLDNTHTLIARLINANSDEIALTENASAAWDIAFYGMNLRAGDEVITSEMEYASNVLGLLYAQEKHGVKITVVANDDEGNFPLTALEAAITANTRLIAITHIPSTAGNILPAIEIGRIARQHNITYLLDASQSAGQMPLDVQAIGCDLLAVTGRKFLRGPRGTGFLYVKKALQPQLKLELMDGYTITSISTHNYTVRNDARRFEWHEKNHAIVLGFNKAIEYVLNAGTDRIWQRVQYLSGLLRQQLQAIPGVVVHDTGTPLCGIVTFTVTGFEPVEIKNRLAAKRINVNEGPAKSTVFYMHRKALTSVVRASVHYYNTEEEIGLLSTAINTIIQPGTLAANQ